MFIDAASVGRNEPWRYAVGGLLLVLGFAISSVFLIGAIVGWHYLLDPAASFGDALLAFAMGMEFRWRWGDPYPNSQHFVFAVYLLSLLVAAIGPILAVKYLHKRPARTLVLAKGSFDWLLLWKSFVVVFIGYAAWVGAMLILAWDDTTIVEPFHDFLILTMIVVSFVPLQVLGEEMIFRGYVLQATARFSRFSIVRILVPSALFFAVHLPGSEMTVGGIPFVLHYTIISLYLTWVTIRTDGLEAGIGLHIGNNFIAILFVTDEVRTISVPALFFMQSSHFELLPVMLVSVLIGHYWFVIRGKFPASQTRTPDDSSGNPSSSQRSSS